MGVNNANQLGDPGHASREALKLRSSEIAGNV